MNFRKKDLESILQMNPTYPFTVNVDTSIGHVEPIYTLQYRPKQYYAYFWGLLFSLAIFIFIMATNGINNSFFLITVFSMLSCVLGAYHHRYVVKVEINHATKLYYVYQGKHININSIYNIYIRLIRVNLPTIQKQNKYTYQLIVKGYKMQGYLIGEHKEKEKLRLLGQFIAQNLSINYFDDNNTSEFHMIRNLKPSKQ
eukprot:NODE_628_length_5237_cov_0.539510.p3 type:complete len:199 gc:universal NODE_628_length_5237_cov_0.539510:1833-1237(-)